MTEVGEGDRALLAPDVKRDKARRTALLVTGQHFLQQAQETFTSPIPFPATPL
eukprot:NODE_410_length_1785_cov_107.646889_g344_i0.p4 GENE.NODE_410_length_1785_cov_107.646889_g344_i0~~NODE_410_length_1785_cov_107.646889_g344_i0.p4  ORF type:complete len:53 (-),score=3.12 NODE_410_length_1785_cov_107.646889_g344_i0:567-725(-)